MISLSCIIVDDQRKAREMLAHHLENLRPTIKILDSFDHPAKAANFLNSNNVELVFLDVEMGSVTGFDLFKSLAPKKSLPLFIFVTAHQDYAIDAIKADAFDYVLKPINSDELKVVLGKAEQKIEEITFQDRIQQLFLHQPKDTGQLQVLVSGGVEFIRAANIIYLKAARNYTEIYLKGGKQIIASKPLAHFEPQLESSIFLRCHRSYIVNIKEIRAFRTSEGGYLELTENHRASITQANKETLMDRMRAL